MQVLYNEESNKNLSLALGFFDGIHIGHKKVIESAVSFAKNNGLKSAVISFCDHPACFLQNKVPNYIISLHDKIKILENLGVDYFYLLNFNENFASMSKEEYFNYLLKLTSPNAITTGFNHFFAKNKTGDTEFLKQTCEKNNITYKKIEPIMLNEKIISSSEIRHAIKNADLKIANEMLGYDFYIRGKVIDGNKFGQKIGYKTLNIDYPDNIIKLPYGVYYTNVEINKTIFDAVTNWGIKPTLSDDNKPVIETHIFNFDKDIYGQEVKISFLSKIRDEKKFDTTVELVRQIECDVEFCLNYKSINK